MSQWISALTSDKLGNSEDGSDHNEGTDSVEHIKTLFPWNLLAMGFGGVVSLESNMEDDGCDDEETKHHDLDEETGNDNVLA